jgi:hypothetical protein
MRIPVPNNKLVAFTLAGALLTAIVAGALAIPGGGLAQADSSSSNASEVSQEVAGDAPTPNQEFTPAVQSQSGYEDEEHEEYEDEEEDDEHEDDHGEEGEGDEYDEDEYEGEGEDDEYEEDE